MSKKFSLPNSALREQNNQFEVLLENLQSQNSAFSFLCGTFHKGVTLFSFNLENRIHSPGLATPQGVFNHKVLSGDCQNKIN
jgi:hypothetical protein